MNTPSARSGRALEMEFIMASGCPAEHPEEGGGAADMDMLYSRLI